MLNAFSLSYFLVRTPARRAMSLIETMVVLIIAVAAISAGAIFYSRHLDEMTHKMGAQQLSMASEALSRYVDDHHSSLATQAQANGGRVVVDMATLKSGYLPVGFGEQTVFGHEYVFVVRRPDPSSTRLEALVYTDYADDDFALEAGEALSLAKLLGASGGYTQAQAPHDVASAYGQYSIDLTQFGATPKPGRLVAAYFLQAGSAYDKYLHRSFTGDPSLNQMNAPLDMAGNAIGDVGQIQAAQVEAQTLFATTLDADTVTAQNATLSGALSAQSLSSTTLTTDQAQANSIVATGPISSGAQITAQDGIRLGNVVNEWEACPVNGDVARNNEGQLLSCQGGYWRKSGMGLRTKWAGSGHVSNEFYFSSVSGESITYYCREFSFNVKSDAIAFVSLFTQGYSTAANYSQLVSEVASSTGGSATDYDLAMGNSGGFYVSSTFVDTYTAGDQWLRLCVGGRGLGGSWTLKFSVSVVQ